MNELRKQFKKDHPETVGETDHGFDNSNYIDWLENRIQVIQKKPTIDAVTVAHQMHKFAKKIEHDLSHIEGYDFLLDEDGMFDVFNEIIKPLIEGTVEEEDSCDNCHITNCRHKALMPEDQKTCNFYGRADK